MNGRFMMGSTNMYIRTLNRLSRFLSDRSGGFAVLFALLSVPLFGMVGLTVDYMKYTQSQLRIDSAADSAALSAVIAARDLALKNEFTEAAIFEEAKQTGLRVFQGNAVNVSGVNFSLANVVVARLNNEFHAEVTWQASMPATFASFVGVNSLRLNGSAKAELAVTVYTTIHVVMDFSESMLIGATTADHEQAVKLIHQMNPTDRACAFLCHITESHTAPWRKPTYPALKGQIRLRTDVMRDAVVRALDDLQRIQLVPNEFRFGIYGFSNDVMEFLSASSSLAGNFDEVRRVVRAADVWPTSRGGSSFWKLFPYLDNAVPASGAGLTQGNRRQVVILITDGIENRVWFNNRGVNSRDATQPIYEPSFSINRAQNVNPAYCVGLKNRGVIILVVNVKYMIPEMHSFEDVFPAIRDTLEPSKPQTLGRCATSLSHYLSADTPQEISNAIAASFRMIAPGRLTR